MSDPDDLNRFRRSGRPMWYDRQGNPIDVHEAERLLASPGRIVAQDHVGPYFISTVHLVLDHSFMGGPPLIFESAVFYQGADQEAERIELDLDMERTPTESAALAMHDQLLAKVRDQLVQDRHPDP